MEEEEEKVHFSLTICSTDYFFFFVFFQDLGFNFTCVHIEVLINVKIVCVCVYYDSLDKPLHYPSLSLSCIDFDLPHSPCLSPSPLHPTSLEKPYWLRVALCIRFVECAVVDSVVVYEVTGEQTFTTLYNDPCYMHVDTVKDR